MGHKPIEVVLEQGAKLWICSTCGKNVQTKKKSIMEECPLFATPYGKAASTRVGRGLHPDSHAKGSISSCWDCAAKWAVSYTTVMPGAKQRAGSSRGRT